MSKPQRTNYFVVCPDNLGLSLLLQGALSPIAVPEDIYFHDASTITKDKARQIENEARMAPRGGSKCTHFYLHGLQKLPFESVGPLLKAVEEAQYARFIFQTQRSERKLFTLMSRSSPVMLPFLSRATVLGNLKALSHDARTADELGLYDGTIAGTIRALSMKDTMIDIRRELKRGSRGLTSLFTKETLRSIAFEPAVIEFLSEEEKQFLRRNDTEERRKLVLFLAASRING